ncbi:transcriptional regulator NrdR [candidate division LCP-89 bacterium B3_LCP]|uniref:Transcriptional repressor NrdR n=1 Tax=candidate division LCP-89 bacterium B3_LCP TaxID=2012998 RepID=A0A532V068_UNCL8|nr:MAG: transcriptional regulator NrdR [candidate division LCP-89 bacterium B3_LCP]
MRCPQCDNLGSRVLDSRPLRHSRAIRRRRQCEHCGSRYTTYEQIVVHIPVVTKHDSRREPFDRSKLIRGIELACSKLPIPRPRLETICDEIESALADLGSEEVTSRQIGESVMDHLRRLHPVAYVRFASVYRRFNDAGQFLEEVDRLTPS